MAEGLRNRNVGPKLGLHLCERCEKDNAEGLKKLLNCCKVEENINELTTEIKEIKKMLKEKLDREERMDDQMTEWKSKLERMSVEFIELSQKFDKFSLTDKEKEKKWLSDKFVDLNTKVDNLKVPAIVEKEMNKKWSDLFTENVVQIKDDMKTMQKTVSDTKQSMAVNADRSARRNNLVIYNFPEDDKDTKSKDKEFINELVNDFGLEFDYQRDVSSMARMGRKIEDQKKCRPLIVKFYSYTTKNMILENCFKLKRLQKFKSLIISHDLSREDREQCRLLIKKAKEEKEKTGETDKYIYKVRGEPGSFHVVLVRRPNLSH